MTLSVHPEDLTDVVEDTLLLTGKQLGRDGMSIATDLDPALPRVLGDATALEQVLMNLVLNAREAMPRGGTLRIETAPREHGGTVHAASRPGEGTTFTIILPGMSEPQAG